MTSERHAKNLFAGRNVHCSSPVTHQGGLEHLVIGLPVDLNPGSNDSMEFVPQQWLEVIDVREFFGAGSLELCDFFLSLALEEP